MGGLSLNMSYNRLSGRIPDALYNTSLSSLELSNNSLTGPLSKRLFEMPYLGYIGLSHNPLNCPLPETNITQFALNILYINGSGLIGNIPNLTNFRWLSTLDLAKNKLNGTIPATIVGNGASRGMEIYLDGNNLQGEIPDVLYNTPRLRIIYLYSNNLTGTLKNFSRGPERFEPLDM